MPNINIEIWNEYRHERHIKVIKELYPSGIYRTIQQFLQDAGFKNVRTATLDEPSHGLTDEVLHHTEVLVWWGHAAHEGERMTLVLAAQGFVVPEFQ